MWKDIFALKPVYVDGFLYVLIALFGAMEATFTSDEAYKYFNPYFLYYSKEIIIWLLAIVTALKMFRSTSFGDHKDEEKAEQAVVDGNNKVTVVQTQTNEKETKIVPSSNQPVGAEKQKIGSTLIQ